MGLTRRTHNSKLFMSKSVSTHLTMADSMIFIAAIALGLWGCRLFLLGPTPIPFPFEHFIDAHMQAIFMTAVLVMSLTLALIAIPIATFRYRLRRLLGSLAPHHAVSSRLTCLWYPFTGRSEPSFPMMLARFSVYLGGVTLFSLLWCSIGVVTALVFVVLTGCCRLPPDWLDWLRLVIGLYWISMFFVVVAYR